MAVKPGNGGKGERDPRLDLLYRDAAREAPPAHLDAAILAAARREVGARPRGLASPLRRWRVPVSIAAIVVLSVSLVTLVREEGGDTLLRDAPSPAALPPRAAEPAEQPAESVKGPEVQRRMRTAPPEERSLRRDEPAAKAPADPKGTVERERAGSQSPPVPQGDSASGMLSSQALETPQRLEEGKPLPQAPSVGARDAAPPAAAPAPKAMERRKQPEQELALKGPPVWHGLEQEPPQRWVERLAELRRQGRTGEAEELLVELKRRFPDHPLPGGLE